VVQVLCLAYLDRQSHTLVAVEEAVVLELVEVMALEVLAAAALAAG
jgi:hypothetical protein